MVCQMDYGREGGGWTLVIKNWYSPLFNGDDVPDVCDPSTNIQNCNQYVSQNAMGTPADAITFQGNYYKVTTTYMYACVPVFKM